MIVIKIRKRKFNSNSNIDFCLVTSQCSCLCVGNRLYRSMNFFNFIFFLFRSSFAHNCYLLFVKSTFTTTTYRLIEKILCFLWLNNSKTFSYSFFSFDAIIFTFCFPFSPLAFKSICNVHIFFILITAHIIRNQFELNHHTWRDTPKNIDRSYPIDSDNIQLDSGEMQE